MSSSFLGLRDIGLKGLALFLLLLAVPGGAASAADEPDLIFRRSTVFKWVSPNDKLATYGLDDPEVGGHDDPPVGGDQQVVARDVGQVAADVGPGRTGLP